MTIELRQPSGLARRSDNFEEQVLRTQSASPNPGLNRLKVDKALALGTSDELTPQERCLMMALLAHLDIGETASGQTSVWPGSKRLCALLSMGESTLRRLKGSLEEKGFLLRRYDRCNRPLKGGALDLSPFLQRVDELCDAIGHTEKKVAAVHRQDKSERVDVRPTPSAGALKDERLNRNTQQDISERPFKDSDWENLPQPGEPNEKTRLAEQLLPGISSAPSKQAMQHLGSKKGPRLWFWAEKRHGEDAPLALAIAATDPKIKDRTAWFAWFATSAAEVDLVPLAETLLSKRCSPIEQQTGNPLLTSLLGAFSSRVGAETALSYLARARLEQAGESLLVVPESRTAEHRLRERYEQDLKGAAQELGFHSLILGNRNLPASSYESQGRPDEERRKLE